MISIVINGEETEVNPDRLTIQKILVDKGYSNTPGLAVAINEYVIPKSEWDTTSPNPNDKILIIKAVQGG
jgi:sulfur carrier protein